MFATIMLCVLQILCPGQKIPQADEICMTKECLRTAEMYRNSMKSDEQPCHNFFDHVCGNYPNFNKIPPYRDHYTAHFARLEKVDEIISDYIKRINFIWQKGFQNIRTFYDLCMNEDQRRQIGYKTLEQELDIIGMSLVPPFHSDIKEKKDFAQTLGKIHRFSLRASKFLFDISVHVFPEDMKRNVIELGTANEKPVIYLSEGQNQNGGLPTNRASQRELFIQARQRYMMSVVIHLYNHLKFELTEIMKKEIMKRIIDVVELEDLLNKVHTSIRQKNSEQPNVYWQPPRVKAEMDQLLEGGQIQINFSEYLEVLFSGFDNPDSPPVKSMLEGETFNLTVMISAIREITEILKILRGTSSSVFGTLKCLSVPQSLNNFSKCIYFLIESLIWWSVIESLVEEGPSQLNQYHKEYAINMEEIFGHASPVPRSTSCMTVLKTYFGKFVGHVLAKTRNGKNKKEKITEMFENIRSSYEENIQGTEWADDETKEATLKKIQRMTAFIGFDNSLLKSKTINREYRQIDIEPGNYYKLLAFLYRQKRETELFKLFTTNDLHKKPEHNPADLTGSHYMREYNQIVITMTDIEFPFYNLGLEVLHYATLGYTIARQMGHSIDEIGSLYDAEGKMNHCLTDNSAQAYEGIVECFIESYSNVYFSIHKKMLVRVNGNISVDENMADWQGFNMAMMAYQKYVEKYGDEPKLTDFFKDLSTEQLFTLAYSNQYCINSNVEYMIHSATCTSYAPERTRVNAVLRNSSQFSDAWGCAADRLMNPAKKCEIWFWNKQNSNST